MLQRYVVGLVSVFVGERELSMVVVVVAVFRLWCWCGYLRSTAKVRIFLQGARLAPMKGVLESPGTPRVEFGL